MPEKQIHWYTKIKNQMPIILITAVISVLISYFFIVAFERTKKPVYSISEKNLLVELTENDSLLQIIYDKKHVENVVKVEIALWNSGKQCIDQDDFLDSIPLIIKPTKDIDILNVVKKRKSRESLDFSINVIRSDSVECIELDILNGEVLEKDDGILLHILYSGDEDASLIVPSRIKNVPQGVTSRNWRVHYYSKEFLADFLAGLGLFLITIFGVLPLMGLQLGEGYFEAIKENWKWQLLLIAGSLFVCLYSLTRFLFFNVPSWIK